jgi:ATP-dependent Clp protease ATP-binding subunit ClpA
MFERFTKGAREAVARAQEEARGLGAGHIGTEHLLLGVATGSGTSARVLAGEGATPERLREAAGGGRLDGEALASLGIDLDEVRRRVEATFGPGALERGRPCRDGHVPFTPAAKKALELALREAVRLGDRHIGAEHLLLGLVRDEKAEAVAVLRRAGADPARIRDQLTPAGSRRGREA